MSVKRIEWSDWFPKQHPVTIENGFIFILDFPSSPPLFLVVCLMYNNNKKKPPDLYIQRKSLLHPSMAIGNTHTQKLNIVFRIKKNQSKVHCFQPNRWCQPKKKVESSNSTRVRLRWLSAVISNEKNSDGNGSVQSTPRRESFSVQPNTTHPFFWNDYFPEIKKWPRPFRFKIKVSPNHIIRSLMDYNGLGNDQ